MPPRRGRGGRGSSRTRGDSQDMSRYRDSAIGRGYGGPSADKTIPSTADLQKLKVMRTHLARIHLSKIFSDKAKEEDPPKPELVAKAEKEQQRVTDFKAQGKVNDDVVVRYDILARREDRPTVDDLAKADAEKDVEKDAPDANSVGMHNYMDWKARM